jgi:hypothetical protein
MFELIFVAHMRVLFFFLFRYGPELVDNYCCLEQNPEESLKIKLRNRRHHGSPVYQLVAMKPLAFRNGFTFAMR